MRGRLDFTGVAVMARGASANRSGINMQQEPPVFNERAQVRHPLPPDGVPASVLLVDDNPSKLTALAAVIADMGLDIATATSGREALRLLLQRDFAVILLDVKMPVMDGFETAALIHGRPKSAHTPIIFVTAEADTDSERFRGYTAGASRRLWPRFFAPRSRCLSTCSTCSAN